MTYDVVIVGTGPAGLSAALTLGRARRATLVIDGGPGRNAPSDGVHNFLSRDGIAPTDLRNIALEQLSAYATVEIREGLADRATAVDGEFELALAGGHRVRARRLLLATGVLDELPAIAGLAERWGHGVVHRPYCHGWERRDLPLAVLAPGNPPAPVQSRRRAMPGRRLRAGRGPAKTAVRRRRHCGGAATDRCRRRHGAVVGRRRRFAAGPFGTVRTCPAAPAQRPAHPAGLPDPGRRRGRNQRPGPNIGTWRVRRGRHGPPSRPATGRRPGRSRRGRRHAGGHRD